MDAFQHINNTVYFRYFENARIDYFEKVGVNALMKKSRIGPILGSTACKYLAPLTFPDTIIVSCRVSEINQKRFTQRYEIFSCKLEKVVASGSGEIVYLNYGVGETCAIPDEIVRAITDIEA